MQFAGGSGKGNQARYTSNLIEFACNKIKN